MTKKLKDIFRKLTGISTPIGGLSWQPADANDDTISPLTSPVISVPKAHLSSSSPLEVRHILEGERPDSANRIFDVIISNPSRQQLLLTEFHIEWRYHQGMLCSGDEGVPLVPVAEYVITLPIDPDSESENRKVEPIYPVIAIPPQNQRGSSMTTLRLQFHYHFVGRIDWHPCADWNIFFTLGICDDHGGILPIFTDKSWRSPIE